MQMQQVEVFKADAIVFVPLMTIKQFAEMVGVTELVVTNWVRGEKAYLPTVRVGRRKLINIAAITSDAIAADDNLRLMANKALEAVNDKIREVGHGC